LATNVVIAKPSSEHRLKIGHQCALFAILTPFAVREILGLYIGAEVFTNNVIEPFAIGGSTGMSPLAVIISALFWTWL
jgi:predicted PurR-regulated permease PerM